MGRLFLFAAAVFALLVPFSSAGGSPTTYYVSASGSDSNPGTQAAPWRTIAKVNSASLSPGDTVLFQGGQTFSDTTLMPPVSGTSSAPISFGSYGTGAAQFNNSTDVWIPSGGHDLVFDGFDFTGTGILFASAATGPGTYDITIKNSAFHDTPQTAINISQHPDHNWTITNSSFRHIGDSGLISWGANVTLSHSTITDTGWNPAITWGKHGIYDKGIDSTIAFNDFSGDQNGQAISVRMHGAQIYGNTIHDTPQGIAFFDYDTTTTPQGTDYVYDNRLWNIDEWGFYYSNYPDPQGQPPSVSFVVASNTFSFNGASEAVNLSETPSQASITLANNIFTGNYQSAYRGCPTCTEHNNDWYGANTNLPTGAGDLSVNPSVTIGPAMAAATGSKVIDAGTTSVPGLSYTAACDGGLLHYCGSAPDEGAGEFSDTGSTPPAPAPVTPPAPTPPAPTPTPPPSTTTTTTTTTATPPPTTTTTTTTTTTPPASTENPTGHGNVGVTPAPVVDSTAPTAPGTPSFLATRTGGLLSWKAASDNVAVAAYDVTVNGSKSGTTASLSYNVDRLACGTSYTFGIVARDGAGNDSPAATLVAKTAKCPVTSTRPHGRFNGLDVKLAWQQSRHRLRVELMAGLERHRFLP